VQASELGMGVGRISRLLRGVGVTAMPDAGLDTSRRIEVPLGTGVPRLLLPSMPAGVFIDRYSVADRVEGTR
jgi:hypothetical protein